MTPWAKQRRKHERTHGTVVPKSPAAGLSASSSTGRWDPTARCRPRSKPTGWTQGKARNAIARPGQAWHQAAKKWQWRVRAEAFDDAERARLRATEAERRFDARLRRLAIVEQLREEVVRALALANLSRLSEAEAREMFSSLRIFLKDLLLAERLEYGEATEIVEQPEAAATIAGEVERMLEKAYGVGDRQRQWTGRSETESEA